MENKVYLRKELVITKIIEIVVFIAILVSITFLILDKEDLFRIGVIVSLVVAFAEVIIEAGNGIIQSNKVYMSRPLLINDGNLYIIGNKSLLPIIVFPVVGIILLILKPNSEMLNYYFGYGLVSSFGVSFIVNGITKKYLKENSNNIDNIINNKKITLTKIAGITHSSDGSFIFEINGKSRAVCIDTGYENYEELMESISSMSVEETC